MNQVYDVVVVGGGPAGMAAAVAAKEQGAERVLLLDRNAFWGGILPQCIHDGFGLAEFKQLLTGPEYAEAWQKQLGQANIACWLQTTVLKIAGEGPFTITVSGPKCGLQKILCRGVVLATGCRERSWGQLRIPGSRPAGVFTAGAAQFMMNRQNLLPGKSVVILGLGDVGLIMARRLCLEGVKVKLILGQQAGGLLRNYIQCVRDFNIPLQLGYTVVSTHGNQRLKGVSIAPITETGSISYQAKRYVPCDTLLVAAGLIPETELWQQLNQPLNELNGVPVDAEMATPYPGIFACGNLVRVYDTADQVSQAGRLAGAAAARWLVQPKKSGRPKLPVIEAGRKLTVNDIAKGNACLVCTLCPKGCVLEAVQAGSRLQVTGNRCSKGVRFAEAEVCQPQRILTTTVRLKNSGCPLLPVRTDQPVPRQAFGQIMAECRRLTVTAPVNAGVALLQQVAGCEANLVAAASAAPINWWEEKHD